MDISRPWTSNCFRERGSCMYSLKTHLCVNSVRCTTLAFKDQHTVTLNSLCFEVQPIVLGPNLVKTLWRYSCKSQQRSDQRNPTVKTKLKGHHWKMVVYTWFMLWWWRSNIIMQRQNDSDNPTIWSIPSTLRYPRRVGPRAFGAKQWTTKTRHFQQTNNQKPFWSNTWSLTFGFMCIYSLGEV